MIIGTCGFCSTGSSAVSDYLKEFDENQVLDGFEFTIPYLPDGLEDLEYNLTSHICRDDCSSIAIPRFRRFMQKYEFHLNRLYSLSPEKLHEITERLIEQLVQFKWHSLRRSDVLLYPTKFYRLFGWRIMRGKVIPWLNKRKGHCVDIYPYRDIEVSINPSNFESAAKEFLKEILEGMGADFSKNIVLDQPFIGEDPVRSFHFFENPKAIIVDRDPRDNYLFTKKMLYKYSNIMPVDTVQNFVTYYKLLREGRPYKTPNKDVLCMHFEEMVYDYDKATAKIREFCGLGENPHPLSIFDPKISMPNTQLYLRYPEYADDIKYIEDNLPDYLFDFSPYPKPDTNGKMFQGRSPLNKSSK